ncbi:MAG TPA: hypothetical protein VMV45_16365, partial [Casimicrobiaceae bacterium]|nr:hypothetical protein [Casimicrobiaceae bacterium]
RTLLAHQQYFGLEPTKLRIAAGRMMARIVGLPPERARVTAEHVRIDFGIEPEESERLAATLVGAGLLRPHPERRGEFLVTPKLIEYAAARVVEPLLRPRAKLLLDRACTLAEHINGEWLRNPLEIDAIAVTGSYMTGAHHLTDLTLGIVVGPRLKLRARPWAVSISRTEGAQEIRAAFQELSSFVSPHVVSRRTAIPRPFSIAWEAQKR